jgi:hypothetical protein
LGILTIVALRQQRIYTISYPPGIGGKGAHKRIGALFNAQIGRGLQARVICLSGDAYRKTIEISFLYGDTGVRGAIVYSY